MNITYSPSKNGLTNEATRECIPVQTELAGKTHPELLEYIDWNSGLHDHILTPGGLGQIIGQHLKFDASQIDQGVFFVTPDGSFHQTGVVSNNTDGGLTVLVPISLTPGHYTLEVRTNLAQGSLSRGSLETPLTVH